MLKLTKVERKENANKYGKAFLGSKPSTKVIKQFPIFRKCFKVSQNNETGLQTIRDRKLGKSLLFH
jgi:hypothetical protein